MLTRLHCLSLIVITFLIIITAVQEAGEHEQDLYHHHNEHYDEEHQDQVTHQVKCLSHPLTFEAPVKTVTIIKTFILAELKG